MPAWRDNAAPLRLLRPVAGVGRLTPPPESGRYLPRIRDDLRRRIARGGRDAKELQRVLERLDRLTREPPL